MLAISSFDGDQGAVDLAVRAKEGLDSGLFASVAVVDSGDPARCGLLEEALRDRAPGVEYVRREGNLGAAGNLLERVQWASEEGADLLLAVNADGILLHDNVRAMRELFSDRGLAACYPLAIIPGGQVDLSGRHGVPVLPSRVDVTAIPETGTLPVRWGSSNGAMYRVSALHQAGVARIRELWHGWEDLATGLLLSDAGFRQALSLEARQPTASDQRTIAGKWVISAKPPWTGYYGVRNLILVSRIHPRSAPRVALRVLREFLLIPTRDRALDRYRLAVRGLRDGLRGRGGWAADRTEFDGAGGSRPSGDGNGPADRPLKVLFVTWDGPGTTYHETLFLPLLDRARRPGDEVSLLQFTWEADDRSKRVRERAQELGMEYVVRSWDRQPRTFEVPAAILRGALEVARAVKQGGVDVVLARSIIPGAMALGARRLTRRRFAFIYDADGLPADERVEFGGWDSCGWPYRAFRRVERTAVRRSDAVLVRTSQAVEILASRTAVAEHRFHVVTNGKDPDVYCPGKEQERLSARAELGITADSPLLVYAGSVGPQYRLPEMVQLFHAVKSDRKDAAFLFLTPARYHERVRSALEKGQVSSVNIREARPSEVPRLLAACDLGIALRTPSLSQSAVAPIKVAEYLMCGLPVAYTTGVGDLEQQLPASVGFPMGSSADADAAARWLMGSIWPRRDEVRREARRIGIATYSLERGASEYGRAIRAAVAVAARNRS